VADRLDDRPVLVTSKGSKKRPQPYLPAHAAGLLGEFVGQGPLVNDLLTMLSTGTKKTVWAYAPIGLVD
jgi:hypothetical protein